MIRDVPAISDLVVQLQIAILVEILDKVFEVSAFSMIPVEVILDMFIPLLQNVVRDTHVDKPKGLVDFVVFE